MSTNDSLYRFKVNTLTSQITERLSAANLARRMDGEYDTDALQTAARLLIDLRAKFVDSKGRPDYTGASFAYRNLVAKAYTDAGVAGDDKKRMMSAVRYHVSNALRDVLTDDELRDYGLIKESSIERQRGDRAKRAARLRQLNADEKLTDPDDVHDILNTVSLMVGNIDPDTLAQPEFATSVRWIRNQLMTTQPVSA